MYADRIPLYRTLERERESKLIVYVTGDRRHMETQLSSEVSDFFVHHLDQIGVVPKISLLLYTRGGETLAAWSLVNLLRSFCDRLEVIVPYKCHSAGTLVCLGADSILMTKQATLGPIDPSVNTPLNPQIAGGHPTAKVPVSVEDVNAFIEYAKHAVGDGGDLNSVFERLAGAVHPIVLGNAFRARSQIRMLGSRLLRNHMEDEAAIAKILDFLCSESGSHDYTVNRREARALGLPIETPSQGLYDLLKQVYDTVVAEMCLTTPYEPNLILAGNATAPYALTRALVESAAGGSHAFVSSGTLTRRQVQLQPGVVQDAINDERRSEGWKHRNA